MSVLAQWMTVAEIDSAELLPVWPEIAAVDAAAPTSSDHFSDDVDVVELSDDEAFDAFFGVQ